MTRRPLYSRNDPMLARFRGPQRYVRIEPAFPRWELAICALVAFAIGVMVAAV